MPPRRPALLAEARARIARASDPHVAADVNDSQIKAETCGDLFDRSSPPAEDEAFPVLRCLATGSRDGTVAPEPGDPIAAPRATPHRPRAPEPLVLPFEPAATPGAGDARSALAITGPERP